MSEASFYVDRRVHIFSIQQPYFFQRWYIAYRVNCIFGVILWSTVVTQLPKLALYQRARMESWATGVYLFLAMQ